MDRRKFLGVGAALGAAVLMNPTATAGTLAADKKKEEGIEPKGRARMRIGILSDIHITTEDTTDWLEKALLWFRDRGVDGVVVAGDIADWGTDDQLGFVAATWDKVFPDAGKAPAKLFVTGNHDLTAVKNKRVKGLGIPYEQFIINHKEESWEKAFKEKYEPIWKKEVCGFTFIGGMFVNTKNMPGLEEFMANADLPSDKPFFYIQHTHPKDTCSAPWTWGQDDGSVTKILSKYPNAIAFSGHSHTSLTDDRTLWQGAFTSIGTASLRYLIPFGGRENTVGMDEKKLNIPSQMPVEHFDDGQQGMFMTVYDNCIVIEKHEFHYGGNLGYWTIPLPLTSRPLTFEARAANCEVPQFEMKETAFRYSPTSIDAAGSTGMDGKPLVTVTEADGEDRYGASCHQFTVHFPTVRKPHAFDYEVSVEEIHIDTVRPVNSKKVLSPKYHLSAENETQEMTCVFADFELNTHGHPFRFCVRPCNCYGVAGKPACSAVMQPLAQ